MWSIPDASEANFSQWGTIQIYLPLPFFTHRLYLFTVSFFNVHQSYWARYWYRLVVSPSIEDRWVHAAMRLISIESSFHPCNIYRDCPRGQGLNQGRPKCADTDACFVSFLLTLFVTVLCTQDKPKLFISSLTPSHRDIRVKFKDLQRPSFFLRNFQALKYWKNSRTGNLCILHFNRKCNNIVSVLRIIMLHSHSVTVCDCCYLCVSLTQRTLLVKLTSMHKPYQYSDEGVLMIVLYFVCPWKL